MRLHEALFCSYEFVQERPDTEEVSGWRYMYFWPDGFAKNVILNVRDGQFVVQYGVKNSVWGFQLEARGKSCGP